MTIQMNATELKFIAVLFHAVRQAPSLMAVVELVFCRVTWMF